ncbi:MAG: DUF1153 domain-containing protein [Sphingomonadales bacterium]
MKSSPDDIPLRADAADLHGVESIPPATTTRWFPRQKAEVVAAVRAGRLKLDDACRLYQLSLEEFMSWQRALRDTGLRGLQVSASNPPVDRKRGRIRRSGRLRSAQPVSNHV